MRWARGIVFAFAAQPANVDTQVFGLAMVFRSPQSPQQRLVRENLAGMQRQFLQQGKFRGRELYQHAIFPYTPLLEVDFQLAKAPRANRNRLLRPVIAPQYG